jgi:CHAD domain-containing protein
MAAPQQRSTALARKALLKLTHKNLERFVSLVPRFLVNDNPELIHDLRVRSRRLQQTLRVVLPRPKPRGARKVIKILRQVRQALGPCRNLDVNLALAHKRAVEAQAPGTRAAWESLAHELSSQRSALLEHARQRIGKHELNSFIARTQAVLATVDSNSDPLADMEDSLRKSVAEWDEAYALAEKNRAADELHALRIAGKRLRYRAEILADVGVASMKPMTKDLKHMQSALGDWHDRSVLLEFVADFIRRPEFIEHHPDRASALLGQMEEELKRSGEIIEEFLAQAPRLRKRWTGTGGPASGRAKLRIDSQ